MSPSKTVCKLIRALLERQEHETTSNPEGAYIMSGVQSHTSTSRSEWRVIAGGAQRDQNGGYRSPKGAIPHADSLYTAKEG